MKLRFLWLALSFLACACANLPANRQDSDNTDNADSTDLVLRISRQSRLYTAECKVHKVVTHEDLLQWEASVLGYEFKQKLPLGNRKIAIPIDVTLRVYIDFSRFGPEQVERSGESVRIILPNPRIVVSSSRVDHQGIRQYTDITRHEYTDEEKAQVKEVFQKVADLNKILDKYDVETNFNWEEYWGTVSQYFVTVRYF